MHQLKNFKKREKKNFCNIRYFTIIFNDEKLKVFWKCSKLPQHISIESILRQRHVRSPNCIIADNMTQGTKKIATLHLPLIIDMMKCHKEFLKVKFKYFL